MSRFLILSFFCSVLMSSISVSFSAEKPADPLDRARKLVKEKLPKDAYELLQPWTLQETGDLERVGEAVGVVVDMMDELDQTSQIDAYLDEVIERHQQHAEVLKSIGVLYASGRLPEWGAIRDGRLERGGHEGRPVTLVERDRVRGLQLLRDAETLLSRAGDKKQLAKLYLDYADAWGRYDNGSWELLQLTDIDTLPEAIDPEVYRAGGGWNLSPIPSHIVGQFGDVFGGGGRRGFQRKMPPWLRQPSSGAPVDAEGNPIYHTLPESFIDAANDGQRWRWCLEKAAQLDPELLGETLCKRAAFNNEQFGVGSVSDNPQLFHYDQESPDAPGPWAFRTLKDDETISELASGLKRFTMPAEYNPIALYKRVIDEKLSSRDTAIFALAGIFEQRQQYPRAAVYYRQYLDEFPEPKKEAAPAKDAESDDDGDRGKYSFARERHEQITGNLGEFSTIAAKQAGQPAALPYSFRNGRKVTLTVQPIDVGRLLADITALLKSPPADFEEYSRIDEKTGEMKRSPLRIEEIGMRLLEEKEAAEKYLGQEIARQEIVLEPAPDHFNRMTTLPMPATDAGAYLVTAQMENGNRCAVVVWINDTAIVKKQIDNAVLYYIADLNTGEPVEGATLQGIGYSYHYVQNSSKRNLSVREFSQTSGKDGLAVVQGLNDHRGLNTLLTVTTPPTEGRKGRLAFLGFDHIWFNKQAGPEERIQSQAKGFFMTDRPVYRPGDRVEIKCWVGNSRYDQPAANPYAEKEVDFELYDPRGNKVMTQRVTLDAYGGMVAAYTLPENAMLGMWRTSATMTLSSDHRRPTIGMGTFRVEEYKKPEYEVTVEAPKEPIKLGDTFKAEIKARYYFGSPVTNATVAYKVTSTEYRHYWYPIRPWDWLYGNGYGWSGFEYDWYPNWSVWGCPIPQYFSGPEPSEVIVEREVEIGPDGTVTIDIDTSTDAADDPDQDRRYQITAEVVDASRRTVVGTGSVIAARDPFKVYVSTQRGFYEVDQTIDAVVTARTPDGKTVAGNAELTLRRIEYTGENRSPVETSVHTEKRTLGADEVARVSLTAARPGQYRLCCVVTDAKGNACEGGYIFCIYGKDRATDADFRFDDIELVAEKQEYAAGEPLRLRINADRPDATVLLFVRPENGIYPMPKLVRLDGKSLEETLDIVQKDMPNFFIEALTVSNGKVHVTQREIAVPPQTKIVNVDVVPTATTYKPGEKVEAELQVTDLDGKPVVGQTVVSVYDKSIEYISGGSNVANIKEFFWKWRRHFYSQTTHNLNRMSGNLVPRGEKTMQRLGRGGFGFSGGGMGGGFGGGMGGGMGGGGSFGGVVDAAAPMRMAQQPLATNGAMPKAEMAAAMDADDIAETAVEPTIRENFADTALWVGALETDADGRAKIKLDMPDSLTTWKINVWSMNPGTRVGQGSTEIITRKDMILRMQTPRFLVERDEIYLTANVHNYLPGKKKVQVSLAVSDHLQPLDRLDGTPQPEAQTQTVEIEPNGEARVDWVVRARLAGKASVTMKALSDEDSDAMLRTLPVYVYGMMKHEAKSGMIRAEDAAAKMTLIVPEDRRVEDSRLIVRFSPSLAASLIEALPYLVEYPYGCTEQTLNKFLPTLIVHEILQELDIDLEKIAQAPANLNAQEIGDPANRAAQWNKPPHTVPVYSSEKIADMVHVGAKRLTDMQCADGGWGWFSGIGERSSPRLTALVVRGLRKCQEISAVDESVIERGLNWLESCQSRQVALIQQAEREKKEGKTVTVKTKVDDEDAFVYMTLIESGRKNPAMKDLLWRDRAELSLYGVAMYGIALDAERNSGEEIEEQAQHTIEERLQTCVRMLEQYLKIDEENQTAYLDLRRKSNWRWWCWHGSEFETQAFYLKLLVRTDPKGTVAPQLIKYLLNNRKHATYWNSTRDTALCIEAMAEYLRETGEMKPQMNLTVLLDGVSLKHVEITPENLFRIDNTVVLEGAAVKSGVRELELRKQGSGPVYFNAYLRNYTKEDRIEKAGLEVKVERRYWLLERNEEAALSRPDASGQPREMAVEHYRRLPIEDLATVKSGQTVEIELLIDSKNDYEEIIIEDKKPAGFEPVELRSGYNDGPGLRAYVEYRDEKISMFVYRLMQGKHTLTYRLRAEQPGKFSALPATIEAMYAPELKGNSDSLRIGVTDTPAP